MVLSFFSSRRPPSKQRPSNAEYVPNDPCPRLDFWISGSRDDLVERILPYLTRSYREEQFLTKLMDQHPWMAELVHSESRNEDEQHKACLLLSLHASEDPHGPQEPILIKHAVSHWPATQRWDLEYLLDEIGDER